MSQQSLSNEQKDILQRFFENSAESSADFSNDANWERFEQAWEALEQLELGGEKTVCRIGIPHLSPHFAGRHNEIQRISEGVALHQSLAITASHNSGGMGKTSLVQAFLEAETNPFGMILWTDITPNPELNAIFHNWAEQLKRNEDFKAGMSLDEMSRKMREILSESFDKSSGGAALVVLDDVWKNGLETVEIIKYIVPSGAKFLITTREDEVAKQFEDNFSLDFLNKDDGKQILQDFFSGIDDAEPLIDELLRLLTPHPLTIELAGAFFAQEAETLDISVRIQYWEKELAAYTPSVLWSEESDIPAGLDLILHEIYKNLSNDTRLVFRALGIIAPELPWDLPLLTKLLPELDAQVLETALQSLIQYHLVRIERQDKRSQIWYRQHALVHQYASAQLAKEHENIERFELYSEAIMDYAVYLQRHEMVGWKMVAAYIPHIHYVGDELVDLYEHSIKLSRLADTFARNISSYLEIYRNLKRREWLEMGLKANRLIARHQEAIYQANIAMDYASHSELDMAKDYYEQAIAIFRQLNDRLELARHINSLGYVYRHKGQADLAYEHFQEALGFGEKAGDSKVLSSIFNNLGGYHNQKKELDMALSYYKRALKAAEESQELQQQTTALSNIAHVLIQLEQYEDAMKYLYSALELTKDFENLSSRAATLSNLGRVHLKLKKFDEALQYYQQALAIDERSDDWWGKFFSFSSLGQVYTEMKRRQEALDCYQKALIAAEKLGREDFIQRSRTAIDELTNIDD